MKLLLRLPLFIGCLTPVLLEAAGNKAATPSPTPTPTPPAFIRPPRKVLGATPSPRPQSPLNYDLRPPEHFNREGKPVISNLVSKKFTDAEFKARLKLASRALDEWAQRVEEYGSITMSSPILSREQDGFSFDVKDGADEFYQHAKKRKDGSAAATLAIVNQLSLAGQANFDPIAKAQLAVALKNYNSDQRTYEEQIAANEQALVAQRQAAKIQRDDALAKAAAGPPEQRAAAEVKALTDYSNAIKNTSPTKPTLSASDIVGGEADPNATAVGTNPAQTNLDNTATSIGANFLKSVGALTDGATLKAPEPPAELSDRVALIDAAGTNMIKAIFGVLGHPEKAMQFQDKTVLFATVAVGVNPGWRTRRDFAADITGQASYRLIKARPEVVLELYKRDRLPSGMEDKLIAIHGIGVEAGRVDKQKLAEKAAKDPLVKAASDKVEKKEKAKVATAATMDRAIESAEKASQPVKDASANHSKQDRQMVFQFFEKMPQAAETYTLQARKAPAPPEQLQQQVSDALKDAADVAQKPWENANVDMLKSYAATLNDSLTVLDAYKTAEYQYHWTQQIIPQALIENVRRAYEELTKDVIPAAQSDETAGRELKSAREELAAAITSGSGGGFGSGTGAGTIGKIPFVNDYFDQITFEKQVPLVAGISPLMETQVLDLKDSFGRQDQVAIALAAALRTGGQKGSAQIFDRYMRQQTKVATTLSSLPVVNTFSASGGLFGFQVGPRLRALNDPASRKGGSANVLDRQSFPAALIIGVDKADLAPVICWDYKNQLCVFEPQLVIKQTSRWNPLDGKLFTPFKDPWWNPLSWHNPRYSERDRVDNLLSIADNFRDLEVWLKGENQLTFAAKDGIEKSPRDRSKCFAQDGEDPYHEFYTGGFTRHPYAEVVQSLLRRRDALQELSTGSESRQFLPVDVVVPPLKEPPTKITDPVITAVFPNAIQARALAEGLPPDPQQVANAKSKLKDGNDDFSAHLTALTTQITADNKADLTKDDNVTTLAKVLDSTITAAPTATQKAPAIQILQEAGRYMTEISNQSARLGARITSLKTFTDATTSKKADILAAITNVETQGSILTSALKPANPPLSPDNIKALAKMGPNLDRYTDLVYQVTKDANSVITAGRGVAAFLELPTTNPLVPLVVVGRNLGKTTSVEAVLSTGRNTLPAPDTGADEAGQSVSLQEYGILIRMRVGASAVLHLRVTCEVPDPLKSGTTRKVVLFTPPILINYGDNTLTFPAASIGAISPDTQPSQPFQAPVDQIAIQPGPASNRNNPRIPAFRSPEDALDLGENPLFPGSVR